jgi:hypothetical protein
MEEKEMKTTMTLEKAAELVDKSKAPGKHDLFAHFEELLNPHPLQIDGEWNEKAFDWQEMFAKLCGFGVAKDVVIKGEKRNERR